MSGDGSLRAASYSFWQQSTQPGCVSFYLCKHQKGSLPDFLCICFLYPISDKQYGRLPKTLITVLQVIQTHIPIVNFHHLIANLFVLSVREPWRGWIGLL